MPTTAKSVTVPVEIRDLADARRVIEALMRKLDEQHRRNRSDMEALEARVAVLEGP
ncbi:MAG TPA: hypothetical protein VMY87_06225 [Armatimonadota bacterium]|nr:hypothetical protein [Armatimonadota bacterium]